MRVIEPSKKHLQKKSNPKGNSWRGKIFILIILFIPALVLIVNNEKATAPLNDEQIQTNLNTNQAEQTEEDTQNPQPGTLRTFSGNEFRLLFDNIRLPNVNEVDLPSPITFNDIADGRIRKIGEERGYKLRSSPEVSLPSVQGYQLQESVIQPWLSLQAEAASAGHS